MHRSHKCIFVYILLQMYSFKLSGIFTLQNQRKGRLDLYQPNNVYLFLQVSSKDEMVILDIICQASATEYCQELNGKLSEAADNLIEKWATVSIMETFWGTLSIFRHFCNTFSFSIVRFISEMNSPYWDRITATGNRQMALKS